MSENERVRERESKRQSGRERDSINLNAHYALRSVDTMLYMQKRVLIHKGDVTRSVKINQRHSDYICQVNYTLYCHAFCGFELLCLNAV